MSKEIYFEAIFDQIPRLLGLMDRNVGSPTYGSFDRQYWHYRLIDFPGARFQEASLTLALIYDLDVEKNIYFRNPNLLTWINAALKFWCKIQMKNGSFNEWYPYENSFVATAFSAYAISETLLLMTDTQVNEYELVLAHLKKTGDWLIPRLEKRVANQTAGSAIALYDIYLLTKEEKYLIASREKIDCLGGEQDKEGWFMEYSGMDVGYLSLTIDYLAKYYQKAKDDKTFKILEKAISFISNFVHPNFTFGGSYASRNTEYVIPSGFELMAGYLEKAKILAQAIRKSIKNKQTVIPAFFDDRYIAYLAYNYLQAYNAAKDSEIDYKFEFLDSQIHYSNSAVKVIKQKNFSFFCNYKKGGTFKIVFSNNHSLDDWGVILESFNGRKYFSGWLNLDALYRQTGALSFVIDTDFQEIRKYLSSPLKFIALRFFQTSCGSNTGIGIWLKNKFRDALITQKSKVAITLKRNFVFETDKVIITDRVEGAKGIKSVILGAKVSYIFVPSSCYFQNSDLDNHPIVCNLDEPRDIIDIVREYDFKGNLIKMSLQKK